MKVIVTGATGQVGQHIVRHCLSDSRITKVVILTRTAVSMDVESHPKTDLIMHQDFSRYSDELLLRLQGSTACFWAIGGRPDQLNNNESLLRQINVDLPIAAARIMSDRLSEKVPSGSFHFVFCSNKNSQRHSHPLSSLLGDSRKHRTEVEKGLEEIAQSHPLTFNLWILRPHAVIGPDAPKKKKKTLGGIRSVSGIDAPQLARACIRVALDGYKDHIVENDALLKM